MIISSSSINKKNIFTDKPNEDYLINDNINHIYIISDGVTRDRENSVYPNPSPSTEIAKIISDKIHYNLKKSIKKTDTDIKDSIIDANDTVKKHNNVQKWAFAPGAVCIVVTINNNIMNYAYIGDCVGLIIRNKIKFQFTKSQTDLIMKNKKKFTTIEIREQICNNIKHPYGYGVINGQEGAKNFVKHGSIPININDIIILHSDGLNQYLDSKKNNIINTLDTDKIIREAESIEYNNPNIRSDDKSLIIIKIS